MAKSQVIVSNDLPMPIEAAWFGVGLYTVSDAARITGVSEGRIRRWVKGYSYAHDKGRRTSEAVWQLQLPPLDGSITLGFLDLMEVRFIDAFRNAGVSWKKLRFAAARARELLESEHPFSTKNFQTDGRTIFARIVEPSGEKRLLDLVKSQHAFNRVISPSLYKGIEFSASNEACRWWPLGLNRRVVLDPTRSFGQPIISDEGIPTAVLSNAYQIEDSVEKVSHLFEVDPKSVRAAIEYEGKLNA